MCKARFDSREIENYFCHVFHVLLLWSQQMFSFDAKDQSSSSNVPVLHSYLGPRATRSRSEPDQSSNNQILRQRQKY